MRLLIYTHAFAPKIGGVETYVMLLAQGLARGLQQAATSNLQVTVVTPTPADGMDDAELPFRVIRQPGFAALLRLLWQADVIHLAGPCLSPMLLGLALRKRVVVEHHGYQAVCPNGLLLYEPTKSICPGHFSARRYDKCFHCNARNLGWVGTVLRLLLTVPRRWACGHVAANIPVSNHVKNRIGLAGSTVIYYGIPDPLQDTRPHAGDCAERFPRPVTFAYVGRLVSEKGLDLLVGAARRLEADGCTFRLKFIGDGPERFCLQEASETFGLRERVIFTGSLRGEAFERALCDIDVVVMPSIWEETAGLSAIEHMMRGRLVVSSDIGGLGEMVNGVGIKFPYGDIEGLTSCMKRVLDQPSLAKVLGEKARARALQLFLEERMVAEHLAVYREILRESGPSPTYAARKDD